MKEDVLFLLFCIKSFLLVQSNSISYQKGSCLKIIHSLFNVIVIRIFFLILFPTKIVRKSRKFPKIFCRENFIGINVIVNARMEVARNEKNESRILFSRCVNNKLNWMEKGGEKEWINNLMNKTL